MYAHRCGARIDEIFDIALGLLDHQVDVEWKLRCAPHRLRDDRTDGDVGHEVTVHHVDVHPVGAAHLDRIARCQAEFAPGSSNPRLNIFSILCGKDCYW